MFFKLIQLFLSSFGVIALGVLLSKYTSNFYPYEYIGYLGAVKSYSIFISNLFLLGLNYSFFFLVKNNEDDRALDYVYQNSIDLIFRVFIFSMLLPIGCFLFYWDNVQEHEFIIILLSIFCALVLSVFSVTAKRDAYNNNYSRFFIYTSSNNIILLTLALLGGFLYSQAVFLIFFLLFIVFCFNYFSFKKRSFSSSLSFAKASMFYARYFYLHLFLSTGLLALIQFVLNRKGVATEFNALITIFSLLNVATAVVGNYIFPKLVANSESQGHLFLSELTTFIVLVGSFVIFIFFDFGVEMIFKQDFIQLTIVSVFLLHSKILEISSGILGYKLSSNLQFKKIYFAFGLYSFPVCIGLIFYYYDFLSLNYFCLLIFMGWSMHFTFITIVNYYHQRLRGLFFYFFLISFFIAQYYVLYSRGVF